MKKSAGVPDRALDIASAEVLVYYRNEDTEVRLGCILHSLDYLGIPLALYVSLGCCENSKGLTDKSSGLENSGVSWLVE